MSSLLRENMVGWARWAVSIIAGGMLMILPDLSTPSSARPAAEMPLGLPIWSKSGVPRRPRTHLPLQAAQLGRLRGGAEGGNGDEAGSGTGGRSRRRRGQKSQADQFDAGSSKPASRRCTAEARPEGKPAAAVKQNQPPGARNSDSPPPVTHRPLSPSRLAALR